MKVLIEKELTDPTDSYEIPQPWYHVYLVNEETGEKTYDSRFRGDIKEAARYAERLLDLNKLEVAYKENPDSFKSCSPILKLENMEKPDGEVVDERWLLKHGWKKTVDETEVTDKCSLYTDVRHGRVYQYRPSEQDRKSVV